MVTTRQPLLPPCCRRRPELSTCPRGGHRAEKTKQPGNREQGGRFKRTQDKHTLSGKASSKTHKRCPHWIIGTPEQERPEAPPHKTRTQRRRPRLATGLENPWPERQRDPARGPPARVGPSHAAVAQWTCHQGARQTVMQGHATTWTTVSHCLCGRDSIHTKSARKTPPKSSCALTE